MRRLLLTLFLASGALTACDDFGPTDALLPLADAQTDPALLARTDVWVAVAAVSGGEAYEFTGQAFTVQFSTDGRVSGRASANGYGGEYAAGADGVFGADDIVTTLVGESPRAERLADVLLGELTQASTFEIGEVDAPAALVLQLRSADGDGVRFHYGGYIIGE